jgi:hypothetical protein
MRREPVDPACYARLFEGNSDGELVLQELVALFARPAVTEGGIDAILKTYDRNGSRRVVEFIANKINTANGVPENDD